MFRYLRLGSRAVRAALAGIALLAGGIALVQRKRVGRGASGVRREGSGASSNGEKVRLHVVPAGDGWAVGEEGIEEPLHRFDLKEDALEVARDLANRSAAASLTVHRSDGTIQRHHEYAAEG